MTNALTLLLCIGGLALVSILIAFVIRMVLHVPNAKRNADTMHAQAGGSWAKHYVDEWMEKIQE